MDHEKLDRIVGDANRAADARRRGYREKALKLFPWVCGRCTREFTRANVHELTVHHRDHDHHNNPDDGSNWELLCIYCHDNEHQRALEAHHAPGESDQGSPPGTHSPFADLRSMLDK
ncbi:MULTISPECIES: YajD family HNH nuclease [Spiribacter]|jgi:hypothetical protein|uniref:Putative HNH nuclease YajD n=2 Tax=Spiribacter TaxID=1335745 RepID=A0A557RF91_9GAMM|nr:MULTISPECIES: YajD family HNH nuclease [Spiribacter]PZA00531.1 HNH nuclease family protein [Gammaproteobacteria bacterium 2W06]AUB78429.1 HNH endonuclease [Spiribacter roseus]KAF0280397.1 HNH endonuclease [Spiribacter roseus]KAF0281586.1 HNH endonuclease [Spiribacter roseus]KAF0283376.1 HNH endonuclease [Spiribacter roseus]